MPASNTFCDHLLLHGRVLTVYSSILNDSGNCACNLPHNSSHWGLDRGNRHQLQICTGERQTTVRISHFFQNLLISACTFGKVCMSSERTALHKVLIVPLTAAIGQPRLCVSCLTSPDTPSPTQYCLSHFLGRISSFCLFDSLEC